MEAKTATTLGELVIGDRFTYPKREDVWQVMEKTKTHAMVNQILPWGTKIHMFDEMKRNSIPVVFRRHSTDQIKNTSK